MSKIVVKEGDYLKKGTYIGDAGATGSATGPHLHWEFRINNVLIDGMLIGKNIQHDFKESMKGIFSTTISKDTIDEAPFVYKPINEIIERISDTVEIEK